MLVRLCLGVALSALVCATPAHAQSTIQPISPLPAPSTLQPVSSLPTPSSIIPLRIGKITPDPVDSFDNGKIQRLDQRSLNNGKIGPLNAAINNQSNRRRPPPGPLEPLGIRYGNFTLFPSVEITAIGTTNARRDPTDVTDLGLQLKPSLSFQSDFTRHSFSGTASADLTRFLRTQDTDINSGQLSSDLRLDIMADTTLDAGFDINVNSSLVPAKQTTLATRGTRVSRDINATLGLTRRFGLISGTARVDIARSIPGNTELNNGTTENNADRSFTRPSINLRASYDTGGTFDPFIGFVFDRSFFDQSTDRNGLRRNATGIQAEAGVTFEDPLWSGSISLVGGLRSFDDPALNTTPIAGLNTAVTWRPTELTTVNFNSSATLSEGFTANTSATQNWNASVNLTQQLSDNLNLLAGWSSQIAATGNIDVTYGTRLALSWDINRELNVTSGYEGTLFRSGESSDKNYTDHRVLTTLRLRR